MKEKNPYLSRHNYIFCDILGKSAYNGRLLINTVKESYP